MIKKTLILLACILFLSSCQESGLSSNKEFFPNLDTEKLFHEVVKILDEKVEVDVIVKESEKKILIVDESKQVLLEIMMVSKNLGTELTLIKNREIPDKIKNVLMDIAQGFRKNKYGCLAPVNKNFSYVKAPFLQSFSNAVTFVQRLFPTANITVDRNKGNIFVLNKGNPDFPEKINIDFQTLEPMTSIKYTTDKSTTENIQNLQNKIDFFQSVNSFETKDVNSFTNYRNIYWKGDFNKDSSELYYTININPIYKKIRIIIEMKALKQNVVNISFLGSDLSEKNRKFLGYNLNNEFRVIDVEIDNNIYDSFRIKTEDNTLFIRKFVVFGY